jgi:small-conductance mechanosensitive channel
MHFELLFWVDVSVATPDQARGEIMFVVWESLRRAAIDVPFPQRDLRLREIDPQVLAQLRTLLAAGAVAADLAPTQPAAAAPVDPSATPSSAGTTPVEPSAEPAAD